MNMNNNFGGVKEILEQLRTDYIRWSAKAIDPICPVTERDIVAEIYSRLKDYCREKKLYVHCEMKPEFCKNATLKASKKWIVDVAILADCEGDPWLDSAIKKQNGYRNGKIEARFSSVPIRFWNTAIEVKIQSKVYDFKEKDCKALCDISSNNGSCNCFFVLLKARGKLHDHEKIACYAEERGIVCIEYTARRSEIGKEALGDSFQHSSRVVKTGNSEPFRSGTIGAMYSPQFLGRDKASKPFRHKRLAEKWRKSYTHSEETDRPAV